MKSLSFDMQFKCAAKCSVHLFDVSVSISVGSYGISKADSA